VQHNGRLCAAITLSNTKHLVDKGVPAAETGNVIMLSSLFDRDRTVVGTGT